MEKSKCLTFVQMLALLQEWIGRPIRVEVRAIGRFFGISFCTWLERVETLSSKFPAAVLWLGGDQSIDIDPSEARALIYSDDDGCNRRLELRLGNQLILEITPESDVV